MIEGKDFRIDPKYGELFSYSGTLKIAASCRKNLENVLWFRFADSIAMKENLILSFDPHVEFTEILIKLKNYEVFKVFYPIIDIINNTPDLLFNDIYNLDCFIRLCEKYGKLSGSIFKEPNKLPQKTLQHIVKVLFFLFNPKLEEEKKKAISKQYEKKKAKINKSEQNE